MSKIVVRIPEPKDEYDPSTQRQINRTLSNVIDQLNSTYQQSVKDDQQQQAWFLGQMANRYKNSKVDLTTTNLTTLYTVPAETVSIVKSFLVSNDDASNACEITVTLVNSGGTIFSLFKQKDIAAKTTTELLTQPLVCDESEVIKVQAENANDLHVVLSYL